MIVGERGSLAARWLIVAWFSAGIAAVVLFRQSRHKDRRGPLWRVILPVMVLIGLVCLVPGMNFLRPRTALPESVEASLRTVTATVDPYDAKAWTTRTLDKDEKREQVYLEAEI